MFQIPTFAQSTITRPPIIPAQNQEIKLPHQTGEGSQDNFLINQFLPSIAATIISITGGLALVFVVFNGIRMIASGGNPEQFAKAKEGLIWALAGVVIAGLSFAIVAIISSIRI
ncbi:MAG: pilin [Candidatus Altimarinota bacterium]